MQTKPQMKKTFIVLFSIVCVVTLFFFIRRDIRQVDQQWPGDFRNRVVGARLQLAGKLPYFYHWNPADGTRFLDLGCCPPDGYANAITASPFFHQLIYPIANLSFHTIAIIWVCLQYVMLLAMILMFCSRTSSMRTRATIAGTGLLFPATWAWALLIYECQLYLLVAFLIALVATCLLNPKKNSLIPAGICAAAFVLIRPIALIIFVPFFFQYRRYLLFIVTAFSGIALYGIFVLTSPFERALWTDYAQALRSHIVIHQDPPPDITKPCSSANNVEGYRFTGINPEIGKNPIFNHLEEGNIFVLYTMLMKKKMPLTLLNTLLLITTGLLLILFFYFSGKCHPSVLQYLIFAFTLYMLVELFNPIHRAMYNAVQWFPIILACLLFNDDRKMPAFAPLMLGLALCVFHPVWIVMPNTLGEFCWLTTSLLISFTPTRHLIA
jgi:hypothetical protein